MSTRRLTCEEASSRLLEGAQEDEVSAHAASCEDCGALARDIVHFTAIVDDARSDAARAVGVAERSEEKPALRLVPRDGAVAPATPPSLRAASPRRPWPIAVAAAAALVGLLTALVMLQEGPPPEPIRLRETTERVSASQAQAEPEPPAAPVAGDEVPSVPPAPTPEETQVTRGPKTPSQRSEPRSAPLELPRPLPTAPEDEAEAQARAQRTLGGQAPRLRHCYERALRRDLRMRDARAEITVEIAPNGTVSEVQATGETQGDLRNCLAATLQTARFPQSDDGMRLSIPLRFELQRGEPMGSNVTPPR